jgi:hypothetical protein
MKTIALFFATGSEYREKMKFWVHNSVASFKKWHPDIEVRLVTEEDAGMYTFFSTERLDYTKKMFGQGYNQVIMIGIDIITTGRMTEFLEDTTTPIVGAYEGKCVNPDYLCDNNTFCHRLRGILENQHINTDTVVYNDPVAVDKLIEYMHKYPKDTDQYALNMLNKDTNLVRCIPWPYYFSPTTYNSAALGFLAGYKCFRDDGHYFGCDGPKLSDILPTRQFIRRGDIIYNHEGKIVKSLHFSGDVKNMTFNKLFNQDILDFFTEQCDCDLTIEQLEN